MSQPRGGRWRLTNKLVGEVGQAGTRALEMLTWVSGPSCSGQLQVDVDELVRRRSRGTAWVLPAPALPFPLVLALGRSLTSCAELVSSLCVRDLCPSVCQNCLVSIK